MFGKIITGTLCGVESHMVNIEVDLSRGLPNFNIVGLPDQSIREAKERVRAAIVNSDFEFPLGKITVNLGEGDLKKEGSHFDLPIALGILLAKGDLKQERISEFGIIGELSLDGNVNKCISCMPVVYKMFNLGIKSFIVPTQNVEELKYIKGIKIYPVKSLSECVHFLKGKADIECIFGEEISFSDKENFDFENDYAYIKGQEMAKRAGLISVSGFHHMIMSGTPGSGKTMIAKSMAGIMPRLSYDEMLEKLMISGLMGETLETLDINNISPYDEPHHSISVAGLIGGGAKLKIGSMAKCHNGLILLDELPEFKNNVIQQLREPMESQEVKIARNGYDVRLPCKTLVVATMNPCPCGYYGDSEHECSCTMGEINRYRKKISGPMLDRFDIYVHMDKIDRKKMIHESESKYFNSSNLYKIVEEVRKIQSERFKNEKINCNGQMNHKMLEEFVYLSKLQKEMIFDMAEKLKLSNRVQDKIIKLSRTIADIEGKIEIHDEHILEAGSYRKREW